jgi:hypothetical protein
MTISQSHAASCDLGTCTRAKTRSPGINGPRWLEFSSLGFLSKLIDEGHLDRERFGRFLFHGIEASSLMEKFPTSSKANNYPAMLEYLFDLGRQTADAWLARHGIRSQESTVASRCAITTVVRSCISCASAAAISVSLSASSDEVASSSRRSGAYAQDGASDGDALALAAGQRDTAFAITAPRRFPGAAPARSGRRNRDCQIVQPCLVRVQQASSIGDTAGT